MWDTSEMKQRDLKFLWQTVQFIRENSDVNQWRYIETKKNLADYTSHGLTPSYSKKVKSWISGPDFCGKKSQNGQT